MILPPGFVNGFLLVRRERGSPSLFLPSLIMSKRKRSGNRSRLDQLHFYFHAYLIRKILSCSPMSEWVAASK